MKPAVFNQNFPLPPPYPIPAIPDPQFAKFYAFHKYLQAYTTAFHFHYQTKLLKKRQHELLSRIKCLETQLQKNQPHAQESQSSEKPKRKRRLAQQIERSFVCKEQKCEKNYGTLGSLQQHIRLKHREEFKEQIDSQLYYSKGPDHRLKKQQQLSFEKLQ